MAQARGTVIAARKRRPESRSALPRQQRNL